MPGRPFLPATRRRLGYWGVLLVQRLLSYRANQRPTAAEALASNLFFPQRLSLVQLGESGDYFEKYTSSFSGIRHPWNLLEGNIAPEVHNMFLKDAAFDEDSPQFAPVRELFQMKPKKKVGKKDHVKESKSRFDCEI